MRKIAFLTILGILSQGWLALGGAYGWGGPTVSSICRAALRTLPIEEQRVLAAYEEEILRGALLRPEELSGFRGYDGSPESAMQVIASEIRLLKEVSQGGRWPYIAYRMGILGRIAADLNFPFYIDIDLERPGEQLAKEQYERDADGIAYSVTYAGGARKLVLNPRDYFPPKRADLEMARLMIGQAYENGEGFNGFARRATEREFNRAAVSVSDVWHTVLDRTAVVYQSPPDKTSVEDYHFREIEFFLEKGQSQRAVEAVQEMDSRGLLGSANGLHVAKLFYNAGSHTDALTYFERVLRQDPGNDEAQNLMTRHYVRVGEDLIETLRYEEARDSFNSALVVNPEDDRVAERLQEVSRLIVQRETRRARAGHQISEGNRLVARARGYMMQKDFARALAHYNDAASRYKTVGNEFPTQEREATAQLSGLEESLNRLREDLINQVINYQALALDSSRDKLLTESAQIAARMALGRLARTQFETRAGEVRQHMIDFPDSSGVGSGKSQ